MNVPTNVPLNQPLDIKLIKETKAGTRIKVPGVITVTPVRIEFNKSPFELKDEIKAMGGAKWHGFEDPPRKIWSVENSPRNWFALRILMGENPYEWFDRPLQHYQYGRPLRDHQKHLCDCGLTYHYQIWAADMGLGKTLSAIELLEHSNTRDWWWVGPRSGLYAVEREFVKWHLSDCLNLQLMTYEGLLKTMKFWEDGKTPPQGVIFDESSRLKSPKAQRSQAAKALADGIRKHYGYDGYVILMSGTPSPKSPLDWWMQAEICWPGYLREGSINSFEARMGIMRKEEAPTGQPFLKLLSWRDDPRKCNVCGEFADDGKHKHLLPLGLFRSDDPELHEYVKSTNEVEYLSERLQGLIIVKQKKDCLDLPEKQYRTVVCKPSAATVRVAQALVKTAPNTITGLTWLRELSDGFQYRMKIIGKETCPTCEGTGKVAYWVDPTDSERAFTIIDMMDPDYVATLRKEEWHCMSCSGAGEVDKYEREVREVPTPKEAALTDLLEENEEIGRVVVFSGFTGSVDRITNICLKNGWDVVRVDGRGWLVFKHDGSKTLEKPLDYWADLESHQRVAFVAHPRSGGLGLNLVEARMAIYYSNDFNPESRTQSEDRIHRLGTDMNRGAIIVDLIHLPTDERVLSILKDNRRLELMSMGVFESDLEVAEVAPENGA